MKKQIITLAVAVAVVAGSTSYAFSAGKSGAAFLRIPVGARASAMGEAYGGVAGDLDSLYWNPAGLALCRQMSFSLAYTRWFEDITYQNFAAGYPLAGGYGAIGVNLLSVGEEEGYDWRGYETGKDYSAQDLVVSLVYAREVGDFSVAPVVKIISSKLAEESASAVGLDLGIQRELYPVNLGLSVHNLGTQMKYRDEADPLPMIVRVGAALPFYLSDFGMTALTDMSFSQDVSFKANIGLEASRYFGDLGLYLRGGYKTYAEKLDAASRITAGGGLSWSGFSINYALGSYGDFGSVHRVSLGYVLGVSPAIRMAGRQDPERLYRRGLRQLDRGDYLDAVETFTEVLILDPTHEGALDGLDEANRRLQ